VRRAQPDVVPFTAGDAGPVVGIMQELADGSGWLVLQPAFDEDDAPRRIPSAGLFSSKPLAIAPVCTWVPGERTRSGVEYVALGVEHAARRQVRERVDVPEGWVVQQDNARRGLVVAVPTTVPHGEVLAWLVNTAAELTVVPLNGDWRALVYRR
jgi:hypothetical protein